MEDDCATNRMSENTCTDSAPLSVSIFLKPGIVDDCSNNQAVTLMSKHTSHSSAMSLQTLTKSSRITVTLENESVWSRFHSLGTEMILTKQGRRMFPCCRFKLSGLDPERKYNLVMDIMPLDDFTHNWNGKIWEPTAKGEPHVFGQVCVHPDSPALGKMWMESPVSFYKVKLTNNSTDQEGSVFLHQMHRYQPRLHVVPEDPHSKEVVALDSPNVQVFSFPKTSFYAVTSYQNPQITQLKIDCNPFAMAFRKDSQSIRLLQDRLRLCCSNDQQPHLPAADLASYSNEQNSPCIKDHRKNPESPALKERDMILTKKKNAASSYLNGFSLCKEDMNSSEYDKGQEANVKQPFETLELVAPLDIEPYVTASIQLSPKTINGLISPVSSEGSMELISEDEVNSQIFYAHEKSSVEPAIPAQVAYSRGSKKLKVPAVSLPKQSLLHTNEVNRRNVTSPFRHKPFRRAKKPKSKWWSNAKYSKAHSVITPLEVSLRPDLEDVDGMLFASFIEKEALDIHVQNMKHVEASVSPVPKTQSQPDTHGFEEVSLSVEERISKLESILLLHLKQQKYRQVIHPLLQEVGIKLCLLDPAVSVDLQYLGVRLPFPPPIHNSLDQMNPSSHDSTGSFVCRTGKTNDPKKIKGWRDKLNPTAAQNTPEGPKNISAFCSDLLDEYLENEAQQICDRAAVFSTGLSTPVSYQLPSKSSSYVVTLDSLLKNRCTPLNKVCSNPANNIQIRPSPKSPEESVPLSSEGPDYTTFESKENDSNLASSFQGDPAISSASHGAKTRQCRPQLRWSCGVTPAKMQVNSMLQDMEKDALFHGKSRTHITYERANFALSPLLTSKKSVKRTKLNLLHPKELACSEDFCRLGCICDSLQRKIRGPIHCRRVQCMFDCDCFRHKVLLIHPPKVADVQGGSRRALMAFHTEKDDRPPPASSITTLWKWRTEDDYAEPLFVPEPALSLKELRKRSCVPCPAPQIQEEEKDPVYLYFESMMTCARVREYNSNPPPQLHMLPNKKMRQGTDIDLCIEAGVPSTSQRKAEKSTTSAPKCSVEKPEEPEPTKLLEILSECNWEPHRSLVLNTLFWRISNNLLSEPFHLGVYKVQLLSTSVKRKGTCSTVTYKVCVSREEKQEVDCEQLVKKPMKTGETQNKKGNGSGSKPVAPRKNDSPLISKQPEKPSCKNTSSISPLHTRAFPAGYLKADKKNPGGAALGLVKVNGKMYNQAKLSLGQMGALHPANRFAAFVTGRLQHRSQHQPEVLADEPKLSLAQDTVEPSAVPKESNTPKPTLTVSPSPHPATVPEPNTVSESTKKSELTSSAPSPLSDQSTPLKADASVTSPIIPPVTTPTLSAGSNQPLPVPLLNLTVTPSAGTATIPSGQQMVLQHLPGLLGSSMCCLYNGQIIQIVPVATGPIGQPQPCFNIEGRTPQVAQTATNTWLPQNYQYVQKPLSTLSPIETSPRPFPVTAPKILSLSGSSGMSIASGTRALNLQSSFPGKTGTFSFRICPPSAEGKAVGSQPGAKLPDPRVPASASTVLLPGGFTLIKLPLGSQSGLPSVPTDATDTPHLVKVPPTDEPIEKEISQSCSRYNEQNASTHILETSYNTSASHPVKVPPTDEPIEKESTQICSSYTEQSTSTHILETSYNTSTDAPDSSDGRSAVNSEGFGEVELMDGTLDSVDANKKTAGKYDWVPKGAEMLLKSDDSCKSEEDNLDNWPPLGAEQVLWTEEESADDEENGDFSEHDSNDDASVSNLTGTTDSNSVNTARTDNSTSASDACHFEETDVSDCPQTHRKGLPPETDEHSKKSQASDEPKQQMKSSVPTKDTEQIHEDTLAKASSYTLKSSEQEPHQNVSSMEVKKEPINKPEETLSLSLCNIQKNVLLQEDCSPTVTYSELYNNSAQKHVVAIIEDLTPKSSSPVSTETEASYNVTLDCKLSNHFDSTEQYLGSGDLKIEPNSDPLLSDTCFDLLANEQSSVPEIILPVSHKQAVSRNLTLVSNPLEDNNKQNPSQIDSLFSTSLKSSCFLQQDEDENDYMDIVDVSCPLLEGQTPAISIVQEPHLPSLVSKKTDFSLIHSISENNKLQCKFVEQLGHYSQTFRKADPVPRKDEVPEEPKLEDRNGFQKSHNELHIAEENDLTQMNLYDEDEDPGNDSDSDSSEVSIDKNERSSSSDEEDSINDLEFSSSSETSNETSNESANTSSEEDEDVDIESIEENQEKLNVPKMNGKITKYRESRQTKETKKECRKKANTSSEDDDDVDIESIEESQEKLTVPKMNGKITKYRESRPTKATQKECRKKLIQSVGTFDRKCLSANKLAGRLTHTEKERVRRGEMQQSFASLKSALNIEEQVKLCQDDILVQARLMIRALEDRNRTLEERKKALLRRQSAYVCAIAQLSGKTEDMVKTNFKEHCDQEKWLECQMLAPAPVTNLKVNPQQLDREVNQVPPRLGLWKSKTNHTPRRSKATSWLSSTTPKGKRKKMGKQNSCEEEKHLDIQNLIPESRPPKKSQRLDREGNQHPPRLGLWKSANYVRKRSKKSSRKPSVTPKAAVEEISDTCTSNPVVLGNQMTEHVPSFRPGDVILKLVAQTSSGLPPIPKPKYFNGDPGPSVSNEIPTLDQRALSQKGGPFALPKIVLQSFSKTDTSEKLLCLEKSPLPSSPHTPGSAKISLDVTLELQDKKTGIENVNLTKICKQAGKSSGLEEPGQQNPSLSPPVSESSLQSRNVPENDRDRTAGILRVRKRRAKSEVIKGGLCDPDTLGTRIFRNKSPTEASNRMSTRITPRKKRIRVFI